MDAGGSRGVAVASPASIVVLTPPASRMRSVTAIDRAGVALANGGHGNGWQCPPRPPPRRAPTINAGVELAARSPSTASYCLLGLGGESEQRSRRRRADVLRLRSRADEPVAHCQPTSPANTPPWQASLAAPGPLPCRCCWMRALRPPLAPPPSPPFRLPRFRRPGTAQATAPNPGATTSWLARRTVRSVNSFLDTWQHHTVTTPAGEVMFTVFPRPAAVRRSHVPRRPADRPDRRPPAPRGRRPRPHRR